LIDILLQVTNRIFIKEYDNRKGNNFEQILPEYRELI